MVLHLPQQSSPIFPNSGSCQRPGSPSTARQRQRRPQPHLLLHLPRLRHPHPKNPKSQRTSIHHAHDQRPPSPRSGHGSPLPSSSRRPRHQATKADLFLHLKSKHDSATKEPNNNISQQKTHLAVHACSRTLSNPSAGVPTPLPFDPPHPIRDHRQQLTPITWASHELAVHPCDAHQQHAHHRWHRTFHSLPQQHCPPHQRPRFINTPDLDRAEHPHLQFHRKQPTSIQHLAHEPACISSHDPLHRFTAHPSYG
ncbi:hypothetical protein ACLOJK_034937 [Asimina triloba]